MGICYFWLLISFRLCRNVQSLHIWGGVSLLAQELLQSAERETGEEIAFAVMVGDFSLGKKGQPKGDLTKRCTIKIWGTGELRNDSCEWWVLSCF